MANRAPEQASVLISGGEVVDSTGRRRADVLICDGRIVAVDLKQANLKQSSLKQASPKQASNITVLDARGCVVTPGLVDLFACLGEPGREQTETIATATAAAALGGFTAVLTQPDNEPPLDSAVNLAEQRRLSAQASCTVVDAATLSIGRGGTHLAPFGELAAAGVRWFTDVAAPTNQWLLLRALENARSLSATVAVMPSTPALSAGTVMSEGAVSARLGLRAEPAVSEEIAIDAAIDLARATGCDVHLDRISTAGAVERLRRAKAEMANISASVTAQHLYFIDEDCARFDPLLRAQPPYRSAADREALRAGVADRTIDAVVSGHIAHPSEKAALPFELAPPGALGLQTTAAVAIGSCELELEQALAALSWRPAQLAGIDDRHGCVIETDAPANLTVIDPTAEWCPVRADLVSRSHNSPYLGRPLTGRVRHTVNEGCVIVRDSYLLKALD